MTELSPICGELRRVSAVICSRWLAQMSSENTENMRVRMRSIELVCAFVRFSDFARKICSTETQIGISAASVEIRYRLASGGVANGAMVRVVQTQRTYLFTTQNAE
ncbi:Hypothetical_protein [Hexamita inflata]|uniref:Hypothetical_protein n=1 Tax=Hexamita inflata TaxID=28002 RepID=A0AA86R3X7_9EUKA|nr:Hypothetical protein HINF_LOCUS53347 [Hexamita inflata]